MTRMDVAFDFGTIFDTNIVRLDQSKLRRHRCVENVLEGLKDLRHFKKKTFASVFTRKPRNSYSARRYPALAETINAMGQLSTMAQSIKKGVLTSYDKVVESDTPQTVYLYWMKHPDKM